MSASGGLVSYRLLLLPLLLVFTPFLFESAASLKITYKCLKRGGHPYIDAFVTLGSDTVVDIFGKGAEDSCSLKAKNFTGTGAAIHPYRLLLNVSGIADVEDGVCGIDKRGNFVNLTIITRQQVGTYANTEDKEATIQCDFSKDEIAVSQMQVDLVAEKAIEATVDIKFGFEGSPTQLTVGADTYLEMVITVGTYSRALPYRCWAMRNANDANKVLIVDEYCPVAGAPARIAFDYHESFAVQRSENFKVFRFFDSDVLLIRCMIELCISETHCPQVKCGAGARKKRSVARGDGPPPNNMANKYTSVIVKENDDDDDDSSKLFSSSKAQLPFVGTLFPIAVVLVVILMATVIGLAIKLNRRKEKGVKRHFVEES